MSKLHIRSPSFARHSRSESCCTATVTYSLASAAGRVVSTCEILFVSSPLTGLWVPGLALVAWAVVSVSAHVRAASALDPYMRSVRPEMVEIDRSAFAFEHSTEGRLKDCPTRRPSSTSDTFTSLPEVRS